jgi:anaerobic magnesium-protoporphyrin IX monomethyl ester cyclase
VSFFVSLSLSGETQIDVSEDPMAVDLLLANPLFLSQNEAERELNSPYFPLGLLYLAAYVREHGYSVAVFDGTFATDKEAFTRALEEHRPCVVGLSAVLPNRDAALSLARAAHGFGATVVVGGPDPTRNPALYLAEPAVDIVVHHEGEQTLVELLDALAEQDEQPPDLSPILGLAFRGTDGEPVINPPRPYIANLDNLPSPARDLIDVDQYLRFWRDENGYASLSISVSRGCPYGCNWCQDAVNGPHLRQRSPENVAAEMKTLKETYQIDRLRVVDDVDGLDREWLEAWAAAAEAQGAVIPFEALNDLDRRDIPMLDVRDSL